MKKNISHENVTHLNKAEACASVPQANSAPKLLFENWNVWLPFEILHFLDINKHDAKIEIILQFNGRILVPGGTTNYIFS